MESKVSREKRARVQSQNQIREIVMDSDSGEVIHYACEMDEEQPGPSSGRSSITQPASPDFSASSSEDEEEVGNVTGQQPQPCVWALPPEPQKRVVHTFIVAPKGKSSEAVHITKESTPLDALLLFFAEIITLLAVETYRHYDQNSDDGPSPQGDRSGNVCVFGSDITDGAYSSRQASGLLDENGAALLSILRTNDGTC